MKKLSSYFFVFAIVFSFLVFSCKKYPDGPTFSLRSKTERLSNSWKIDLFKYNGADSTTFAKNYLFNNYVLEIKKNGEYSFNYNLIIGALNFPINESGKWVFSSDKKSVIFTKESGNTSTAMSANTTWEILRLKEKEFWARYSQDNNVIELHLK